MMDNKQIMVIITQKCNANCKHCFMPKSKNIMSDDTLENSIKYIIDETNSNPNTIYTIIFMGGEIGTFNQQKLIDSVKYIRNKCKNVKICTQTNLLYDITDDHLLFFKLLDTVYTSYDYSVRFANNKKRVQWFYNVRYLKGLNIDLGCTLCLTKDVINNLEPKAFFDIMLGLDIKQIELERLFKPFTDSKTYMHTITTNREQSLWLFKAFKIYEELKPYGFYIDPFECIIESLKGNNYHEHSRTCQEHNLTIHWNGDVSQCLSTNCMPFYNVNTRQTNVGVYQGNIDKEKIVDHQCFQCHLYKFCRGDCCVRQWDETGCPTPKQIYEYLMDKE